LPIEPGLGFIHGYVPITTVSSVWPYASMDELFLFDDEEEG
jgi:hypothetical protein